MTQWLRRGSRAPRAASLASWTAVLLMGTPAAPVWGQAADRNVHLILSMKPLKQEDLRKRDTSRRSDAWFLRPNVEQELFTYLQIDDLSKTPNVTVQLLAGGAPIAAQELKKLEEKFIQVRWPRPEAGAGSVPKLSELMKPLELRLLVPGKSPGEAIKLDIYRPKDYLDADVRPDTEEDKNRLIAKIVPKKMDPMTLSPEPPCRVELILDPDRFSGLALDAKRAWSGNVTLAPGDESEPLYLVAEDVRLRPDKRRGVMTLRADSFDRAFLYDLTSAGADTPPTISGTTQNILRINAPRFADPRKSVRMTVEADHVAEPESKRLVLDALTFVDKEGKKHFSRLAEFRGDRDIRWYYAGGGPNGGLQLRPDVKDWGRDEDLSGFHGQVTLRLRLLDKDNKSQKVVDTDKENWVETDEGVIRTIVLDDTPPEEVGFGAFARPPVLGKPFVVQARGIDPESGIRDVVFLLGKLPATAPIPPDAIAVPGKRLAKDRTVWTAELLAPGDARNPLDVSVRFTNNAGLSTTAAIALEVTAPPPPPVKGIKKGSIAGTVMEADRPQKGLQVDLVDVAGKVLVSTKTDAKGAFGFKELAAGDYNLVAVKRANNTRGLTRRPIPLAAGEDKAGIILKLYRQ